jgi:hypothetical protein
MSTFEKLTKRNAKEYFDAYLGRMDAALVRFATKLRELGVPGEAIDYSPESLVQVWKAVHPLLEYGNREETKKHPNLPMWYWVELANNPNDPDIDFTPETLGLIDGLSYYVAKVFLKNVDGMHWEIDNDPKSFFYNKPVVFTKSLSKEGKFIPEIQPVSIAIVGALGALRKSLRHKDERLFEVYNNHVIKGW